MPLSVFFDPVLFVQFPAVFFPLRRDQILTPCDKQICCFILRTPEGEVVLLLMSEDHLDLLNRICQIPVQNAAARKPAKSISLVRNKDFTSGLLWN